jgi:hypothetical protein
MTEIDQKQLGNTLWGIADHHTMTTIEAPA